MNIRSKVTEPFYTTSECFMFLDMLRLFPCPRTVDMELLSGLTSNFGNITKNPSIQEMINIYSVDEYIV